MSRPIPDRAPLSSRGRWDVVGAVAAAVLVGVAFLVPRLHDELWRKRMNAETAPIFGKWDHHVGWGTVPAIVIALAVVLYGPTVARRLRWRTMLAATYATALAWCSALVMVDGWQRGFVHVFEDDNEYLHEVGGVTDIPAMLRGFADRILDYQPDSWTTHVSGHPPGALLLFVWLDRIGLGGPTWASTVCVVVGLTAVLAVLLAVKALASEDVARSAAPFLAITPIVVWIGVSADALFTAITAWAIALLALSATRTVRFPLAAALVSGVLFGFGIYVNYGLGLMGVAAVAVLIAAKTIRPLLPAILGALLVAGAFTLSGFWWLDGYHLVVERYYQGIASKRPYSYWVWANIAAAVCATGLAVPAALHRPISLRGVRTRNGLTYLVGAAVVMLIAADLSALS